VLFYHLGKVWFIFNRSCLAVVDPLGLIDFQRKVGFDAKIQFGKVFFGGGKVLKNKHGRGKRRDMRERRKES